LVGTRAAGFSTYIWLGIVAYGRDNLHIAHEDCGNRIQDKFAGWQPALVETHSRLYFFEYGGLAVFMIDGGDQGGERDERTKLFVIVIDCLNPFH